MVIKRSTGWIYQGVFFVVTGLLSTAILLRSILLYRDIPFIGQVISLLLLFIAQFLVEQTHIKYTNNRFHVYLGLQGFLTSFLVFSQIHIEYDYFSLLYGILVITGRRRRSGNSHFR
jgi:hypothetical protein